MLCAKAKKTGIVSFVMGPYTREDKIEVCYFLILIDLNLKKKLILQALCKYQTRHNKSKGTKQFDELSNCKKESF